MQALREVEGRAIPLGLKNVDTDVIIPAHWLKTITRDGLGRGAFETLRKDPANLFDSAEFKGSPILIAGDNFGCGSSREHAAWALRLELVKVLNHQHVGEIDGAGLYLDPHLAGAGLGSLDLVEAQGFRSANGVRPQCLHAATPVPLASHGSSARLLFS